MLLTDRSFNARTDGSRAQVYPARLRRTVRLLRLRQRLAERRPHAFRYCLMDFAECGE